MLKINLFYDEHLRDSFGQSSLIQPPSSKNIDVIFYNYLTEIPAVEELWNAFLRQEYPGFNELFSSNPSFRNEGIRLRLAKIGDQYWWTYQTSGFDRIFPISFNKEYTVSVNEMLGHFGNIDSVLGASSSDITIQVYPEIGNWTFIPLETMPEMTKTQDTPKQITFQTDIAGSSYSDIKLRFKVVGSGIDPMTIYAVQVTILCAFFCITGFYLLRRRKLKSFHYRL